jgi:hypothetical protein
LAELRGWSFIILKSHRTKLIASLLLFCVATAVVWPVASHYRAKGKVREYRRQLRAQGEKLTSGELAPMASATGLHDSSMLVAAARSLGASVLTNFPPMMQYVSPGRTRVAWQQDPLTSLESSNVWPGLEQVIEARQDVLAEMRAALESPALVFDLDYDLAFNLALPHLPALKSAAQWLAAATILDLHHRQGAKAWANLKALLALAARHKNEPLMISELARLSICQLALNTTWEALQSPDLAEEQLQQLQMAWDAIDLLTQMESVLAMERAISQQVFAEARGSQTAYGAANNAGGDSALTELSDMARKLVNEPGDALKNMVHRYPRYWAWKYWHSYEDELVGMLLVQAGIDAVRKARKEQALGPALKQFSQEDARLRRTYPKAGHWFGYSLLTEGGYQRFAARVAGLEIQRCLVIPAIALKRFRIKHGSYPTTLAELTPEFLGALPRDTMDGKPLHYRAQPDDSFLLYSVGDDGADNGGDARPGSGAAANLKQWWHGTDAVWPLPVP